MRIAILFVAIAITGCPPKPAPSPPDASDASPPPDIPDAAPTVDAAPPAPDASVDAGLSACGRACVNLVTLGCREGQPFGSCVLVCERATSTPLTDLHTSCVAGAKTKAAARSCGSVACP